MEVLSHINNIQRFSMSDFIDKGYVIKVCHRAGLEAIVEYLDNHGVEVNDDIRGADDRRCEYLCLRLGGWTDKSGNITGYCAWQANYEHYKSRGCTMYDYDEVVLV
jgi:hypothetical protein